jgi:putative ATPase
MVDMECLPPGLAGRQYYFPTDRGLEKRIAERLQEIRDRKSATRHKQEDIGREPQ